MMQYGLIGNCAISALVDGEARIVWSCFPRFDGDPIFCRLLDDDGERGFFGVELDGRVSIEQRYVENTALLETTMRDKTGNGIKITDFAPRFELYGRMFHPTTLVRIVEPLGEAPRIRVRCRPLYNYGAQLPVITRGSNHIRYVDDVVALRLTTNAPLTFVLDETAFQIDETIILHFGADESLRSGLSETTRDFHERTVAYWRSLSGRLHIPFEWQDAVIRSAITLKLCSFDETGAIIASPTTSLPETDGEGRNWDYRYCWLRDAFFVVRALNRLGYVETMESHLRYLFDLVAEGADGYLQPVYGIGLERRLTEQQIDSLAGFRGNQPIRVGNQAFEHDQHDGYGSVILAATQAFFDRRLRRPAGESAFARLEVLGEKAWEFHNVPDAGLWEFRTKARVHTHSSVMCWAACDRLQRIAERLGLVDRERYWRDRADAIRAVIEEQAWNETLGSYVASFGGDDIDASLLLMHEVGFSQAGDPRFVATVAAVEANLKDGAFVYRYKSADDFGEPENAFLICSFWYVDALITLGRRDEARALFEELIDCRNHLGLLSEHINRKTGALWGNFPQTYSHVGLINCAMRLSRPWEDVV